MWSIKYYLGALGFLYLAPSPLAASLSLRESGVPALSDDLDALPAAPADIGTERAVRSLTCMLNHRLEKKIWLEVRLDIAQLLLHTTK